MTNPATFRAAVAAGAAAAAAQQDGKTEHEASQQAELTAFVFDELESKKGLSRAAASGRVEKATEHPEPLPPEPPAPAHRRPYKQPGPGLLLRLAHWLNLK